MLKSEEYDVNVFIEGLADELKNNNYVQPPEWSKFVKTGTHKERPPLNEDWWYVRSAAVLRSVAILGPIGVSKLRTKYGGKKNRGHKPSHFYKGSGNIIRKILQQLESSKLIKQGEVNHHKGRVLTKEGVELIKKVQKSIASKPNKLKSNDNPSNGKSSNDKSSNDKSNNKSSPQAKKSPQENKAVKENKATQVAKENKTANKNNSTKEDNTIKEEKATKEKPIEEKKVQENGKSEA